MLFLSTIILYTYYWEENLDVIKFNVGLIASAITIAFFAAPLTKLV